MTLDIAVLRAASNLISKQSQRRSQPRQLQLMGLWVGIDLNLYPPARLTYANSLLEKRHDLANEGRV